MEGYIESLSPKQRARRDAVIGELNSKLGDALGITTYDPFVTVRWWMELEGERRLVQVQMVVLEIEAGPNTPECKAEEEKAAKARREKVRMARLKDKWASPSGHSEALGLGGWLCPDSPTGFCWYDKVVDPCEDNCLGCGFPNERK